MNLPKLDDTCEPIVLSDPECIFYTGAPQMAQSQLISFPSGQAPALSPRWANSLAGAPDSGDIAFTVATGSNLAGGACRSPSLDPNCRMDIAFLRRNAETGFWCGSNGFCATPPIMVRGSAFLANDFDPTQQEDQTLPVLAYYMYDQPSVYWMDGRVSPLVSSFQRDDTLYEYRRRLIRFLPGSDFLVQTNVSPTGWPTGLVPGLFPDQTRPFLDIDFAAVAHLHSHSTHFFYANGTVPQGVVTLMSSPRDPPQ